MVFEINMFSTFNRAGAEPAMSKEMKRSGRKHKVYHLNRLTILFILGFGIKMHCIDSVPWLLSQ